MTTKFLYDGLDIVKEMDVAGNTKAWYVRTLNIDEPLARIAADGTVRYYHADALGSIIALTDANSALRTQYNYSPFGVTQVIGEASDNPFQFTGRENDGTGLYYYRARYYSPEMGRFISEDPIGLLGGINMYAYVGNRPVNFVDPLGLDTIGPLDIKEHLRDLPQNYSPPTSDSLILNGAVQFGGAFQSGNVGASAYSGLAFDTKGNLCIVSDTCVASGTALGIFGTLGIQGSVGTGELCEGTTEGGGLFGAGGVGGAGGGMFSWEENGNINLGKGIYGVGGGIAGGAVTCRRSLICF